MNTWVKVARYNLMRPANYLVLPWILPLCFLIGLVTGHDPYPYLSALFAFFGVLGTQTIGRWLPFGLALGASRRSFHAGTALLGLALAVTSGLVLAALQAIERATNGWGVSMHYLRVPYLLDGPWYATVLTAAVGVFAVFTYGMWHGIVYSRWGLLGTVAFTATQVFVVVAGALIVTAEHWHSPTALGLTGLAAALTVLLMAGGHATLRRAAV